MHKHECGAMKSDVSHGNNFHKHECGASHGNNFHKHECGAMKGGASHGHNLQKHECGASARLNGEHSSSAICCFKWTFERNITAHELTF